MNWGELYILSAPSGTGKTTLVKALKKGDLARFADIDFSVSHTTRKPRASEVDGRDYHFVDEATFQRMIDEGAFLEWAKVHDRLYGTAISEVKPLLDKGRDVLLDIDVKGAERLMDSFSISGSTLGPLKRPPFTIFLMPPTFLDLERRLQKRDLSGTDQDQETKNEITQEIDRRLLVAQWEVTRVHRYDYVIINDDVVRASYALTSIILEKRHRQARMQEHVESVLQDFGLGRKT